ncbi:carbohydrate-binding protein [Hamadaea sp.]|uniref:carbohydrate-binding protein n=1 Tax=Hamadaea sp. TaxID=2024425 RepID=UPI0025BBD461|nr:carbohydrate-binding protein [Hamadaea sp.]
MKRHALVRAAVLTSALLATVIGAPAASAAPTRYEAENGSCDGTIDSNWAGFSGTGFCNTANAVGGSVTWTVTAAGAGTATLGIRYANGTTTDRPANVVVNGATAGSTVSFPGTGAWTTWVTKTVTVPVVAGSNTIKLAATTANGDANIDYLDFEVAAAPVSDVYQAEDCTISQGVVEANHTGFTGTGFVNYDNLSGSYVQCSVTVATAGAYTLTFRASNGTTADRPLSVVVNGSTVNGSLNFASTSTWDTWADIPQTVTLNAGANTVRGTATTANGGPNLDKITVSSGGTTPPSNPMAAAPYEYLGWGSPQDPVTVMNTTGIKWFTLAFILSDGTCNPAWDGSRPLTGGNDQTQINRIRANGGDVMVSIGGWSGNKLGEKCTSASSLAGAYQKVINAYGLKAIDIDIEATEWSSATVRQRVIDALKIVKTNNPGVKTIITFGTTPTGPDSTGLDMISRGANSGLANDVWAIMPFDYGGFSGDMGDATIAATEGLKNAVKNAYGYSDAVAYSHVGFSSMNGKTDEAGETVTVADFQQMLTYAKSKHLGRFAYWSINRDRACGTGTDADACSGISQQPYDFTKIVAQYQG